MKIGIVGDSHNHLDVLDRLKEELSRMDLLLHTGDMCNDAEYLEAITGVKVISVRGNSDPVYSSCKKEEIMNLEGYKILLTHGHRYGVKTGNQKIFYRGKEVGADIAVFGQTHIPVSNEEEGLLLLNPGSVALPRGLSKRSYIILTLSEYIEVEFVEGF